MEFQQERFFMIPWRYQSLQELKKIGAMLVKQLQQLNEYVLNYLVFMFCWELAILVLVYLQRLGLY